jgi:hypothetical protein
MRHYWQCKDYRDFQILECTCLLARLDPTHTCSGPIDPHHYPPVSQGSDDSDCLPFCRKGHREYDTDRERIEGILERSNPAKLKASYWKAFLTFLGLQSQKPVVKVKQRKKPEVVKTSKFQTPLKPNSRKRKESKLRPYDWRLNMQSEVCNEVPD